ncbi:MAG: helix-turn-helix domain-containing protein [Phenylobacterium sp.]|uniref:helix-turn-helix domain-containing protein n=1 Tax=Phenylobacterium sp. TaxID=1871053 RepID=UPI00391B4412
MPLDDATGPDPVDIAIGARIRLRRKSLGVSQSALADRIGVSFQQVQKYERGANRVSGSTLVLAAQALDTTVGWLVGEEGKLAEADEGLVRALGVNGAAELVEAYAAIPTAAARSALLALAEEMANR